MKKVIENVKAVIAVMALFIAPWLITEVIYKIIGI